MTPRQSAPSPAITGLCLACRTGAHELCIRHAKPDYLSTQCECRSEHHVQ